MSQIYDILEFAVDDRVIILDVCLKEIKKFPREIQIDLVTIVEQLKQGVKFSMPLSRPMPSIGKGVHELRLKEKSGQYRVIYFYQTKSGEVYFLHGFKKTTQATPKKNLDLAKKRLRGVQ